MGMDALIRYVCAAHQPNEGARGDLTVHERSWAFCPADERSGHLWRAVGGGVSARELVRYGLPEPRRTDR